MEKIGQPFPKETYRGRVTYDFCISVGYRLHSDIHFETQGIEYHYSFQIKYEICLMNSYANDANFCFQE